MTTGQLDSGWLSFADTIKREVPAAVSKDEWDRHYTAWLRQEPRAVGLYAGPRDLDPFATRSDLAAGPECRTVEDYCRERREWIRRKPSGNAVPEESFL